MSLHLKPRKFPAADVKLLRLELDPKPTSYSSSLGSVWDSSLPGEHLSPEKAAEMLQFSAWTGKWGVQQKQKNLFLRYPPEQFQHKYLTLMPALKFLSCAVLRTNWFWKSGFIPANMSRAPNCNELSIPTIASQAAFLIKS
jgi:hypothetical protein